MSNESTALEEASDSRKGQVSSTLSTSRLRGNPALTRVRNQYRWNYLASYRSTNEAFHDPPTRQNTNKGNWGKVGTEE